MYVKKVLGAVGIGLCCLGSFSAFAKEDLVVQDFEGKDYGAWTAEGEAFGAGPAQGTLPGQMPVSGFEGKGLVNSFINGDGSTGTLTSTPFRIERRYLNFLVGGGGFSQETCMNLLLDGKVVRTVTGANTQAGGNEFLTWHNWDVADLMGKEVVIQIVDRRSEGWGHINVDQIIQSDEAAVQEKTRIFHVEKRYLNIPVQNKASIRRMRLRDGDRIIREFNIELAEGKPNFWVFVDLTDYQGKDLTVAVDNLGKSSTALDALVQEDRIKGAEDLYQEKYRPQFHFSSRRGWNNDPNGLVYADGEYHLYYQHNPYGWNWGNMHWGHAVSTDLVHWQELPIAIYPPTYGDDVFSGSAIVDAENTSGFQTGKDAVIVAAYTSTGRGECIAFSNDRGRTFTEYEGNPVVKHSGRDPKLIWYAPGKHWVMALYDEQEKSQAVAFYSSPNLKDWTFQSRIEGYYECPEIFEMPVDGDKAKTKWVVYAANGEYAVGNFDGKAFTPDGPKIAYNYGNCFYASQTYNNIPAEDGRRIQVAWGTTGHPDMPFNQMMDFPVSLTLRGTEEGLRLFAEPVREITSIYGEKKAFTEKSVKADASWAIDGASELMDMSVEFAVGEADSFGILINGLSISYEKAAQTLSCKDKKAPLTPVDGKIRLRLLVDRASVEIFANDGRVYMPMEVIMPDHAEAPAIFSKGGATTVNSVSLIPLQSAWK